jgi:hypothetical protein
MVRSVSPQVEDLLVSAILLEPFQTEGPQLTRGGEGINHSELCRGVGELAMQLWQEEMEVGRFGSLREDTTRSRDARL